MNRYSLVLIAASVVSLAACQQTEPTPVDDVMTDDMSSSSFSSMQEEMEVMYTGLLEEAGISIYQEGSHRILTDENELILLESSTVDLQSYVGMHVLIQGLERPTVEAGGRIVHVVSISSLDSSSSESSSSDSSVSNVDVGMNDTANDTSSAPSVVTQSSAATTEASDPLAARTAAMAAFKLDAASWTQQYCTSHVGFCIPIPKNAWYKSFGATTSSLWHIELSSEDILNIGDGPVSLNLLSGAGSTDGQIRTEGTMVIGTRAWTENRHFEIRGPVELRTMIEHITKNLRPASES
jgi:hypothetical protein